MPEAIATPPPLHDLLRQRHAHVRVTLALIAANLLVFMAMLAGGAGWWHSSNAVQLAWGANFGPATQDGQWWRLASALFLHFGVVHLALNMWALWDAGQLVERMFGAPRFALLYLASGLLGNLLSLVAHQGQAVSGGASGAIFGVYGALLVFVWHQRRALQPHEFRWLFWGAIGFSAATIVFGLLVSGIDNAAHIGGFLSGIAAGVLLYRPLDADARGARLPRLLAGALAALAVATLIALIPPATYRWSDEIAARREIAQFLRDDRQINRDWQKIVGEIGRRRAPFSATGSFDALALRVDSAVGERYAASAERLAQAPDDPNLPSAAELSRLRDYAQAQHDAARALAEGLRARDALRLRAALEQARRARQASAAGGDGARTP